MNSKGQANIVGICLQSVLCKFTGGDEDHATFESQDIERCGPPHLTRGAARCASFILVWRPAPCWLHISPREANRCKHCTALAGTEAVDE